MTDKKTMLVKLIKFLTLGALVIVAASCGLDRKYVDRSPATELSTSLVEGGRNLNEGEMKTAVRVCYALRTKRNNFNTLLMGSAFKFKLSHTSCEGSLSIAEASTILSQSADKLYFQTEYVGEFNGTVETDINGYLSPLCDKVIKGETPVNYYEKNNQSVEVSFVEVSSGNDGFIVKIGQKEGTSISTIKIVGFDVATSVEALGASHEGLITKETRYLKCNGDPNKYDSLSKTYLP